MPYNPNKRDIKGNLDLMLEYWWKKKSTHILMMSSSAGLNAVIRTLKQKIFYNTVFNNTCNCSYIFRSTRPYQTMNLACMIEMVIYFLAQNFSCTYLNWKIYLLPKYMIYQFCPRINTSKNTDDHIFQCR